MQTVQKLQKGFTLIELMIVVAIIGILAAVALPAYQDYVAKSKVTTILATMAAGKITMFDYYTDQGKMPDNVAAISNAAQTKGFYNTTQALDGTAAYTSGSDTEATFVVTLAKINGNVNKKQLTFRYSDLNGELKFECVNSSSPKIKDKYLPKQCQQVALATS